MGECRLRVGQKVIITGIKGDSEIPKSYIGKKVTLDSSDGDEESEPDMILFPKGDLADLLKYYDVEVYKTKAELDKESLEDFI